mgnify:CR=1 FL=1
MAKKKKKVEAKLNKVIRTKKREVRRKISKAKAKPGYGVKKKERKVMNTPCSKAAQTLRLAPCSNRGPASQAPKCKRAGAVLRNCRKRKDAGKNNRTQKMPGSKKWNKFTMAEIDNMDVRTFRRYMSSLARIVSAGLDKKGAVRRRFKALKKKYPNANVKITMS